MAYASTTTVAVSKSRGEIDGLLRHWGARQVMWGDDWEHGQVLLRFNAVDAGIVTAEALFLPFLEGPDGQTVAEMFLPRLPQMLKPGGARNLLEAG